MDFFRTVEIDLTNPACGYKLGILGEHNATQLAVSPPEELANAAAFNVAFSVGGTVFQSEIAPTENGVYVTRIGKEITRAPLITFQLQAFDDDGNVIGRSVLLRGSFEPGVPANGNPSSDISDSILQNIAKNTAARHTHSNKSTLDKLGEQNNKLTFNGEPVGGGGGTDLPEITADDIGKVLGAAGVDSLEWKAVQAVISTENKLPYAYLSDTPTIPAPYDDTEIKQRVTALEEEKIGSMISAVAIGLTGSCRIANPTSANTEFFYLSADTAQEVYSSFTEGSLGGDLCHVIIPQENFTIDIVKNIDWDYEAMNFEKGKLYLFNFRSDSESFLPEVFSNVTEILLRFFTGV